MLEEGFFTRHELVRYLQELANYLPDDFYSDVYVAGGGAMMAFYEFDGTSDDCDVFIDGATFPPEMVDAIYQVAEDNSLSTHWFNKEIMQHPNRKADNYMDMREHIVSELGWEMCNSNGIHVLTMYPISLPCVCRNKLAPGCFRDKDYRHLDYIATKYGLLSEQDMIDFILTEYPYINDEFWWEEQLDNITDFYEQYRREHHLS